MNGLRNAKGPRLILIALLLAAPGRAQDGHARVSVASFTTSSSAFVDVPDASLRVTPAAGEQWVLFLSARLRSNSTSSGVVEVRYLVNGVERGTGGLSADAPVQSAAWLQLDVLPSDVGPVQVTAQLRDRSGQGGAIDTLRMIAVRMPPGAELHFADGPAQVDVVSDAGFSTYLTLGFTPITPGPFLVVGSASTSEGPNMCGIGSRVIETDGGAWPSPRGQVSAAHDHFSNPRDNWLIAFAMRVVSLSGPQTFSFQALAGTTNCPPNPANLRNPRLIAFRPGAFPGSVFLQSVERVSSGSTAPSPRTLLSIAYPAAVPWLTLQTHPVASAADGPADAVRASFETNGVARSSFEFGLVDGQTAASFGAFELDTFSARTFANTYSSVDGGLVVSRDSVILLLALSDPFDPGRDAGVNGGLDAGTDAGIDAGADAGTDAGTDSGPRLPIHRTVGCSCSSAESSGWPFVALLLAAFGRRWRRP